MSVIRTSIVTLALSSAIATSLTGCAGDTGAEDSSSSAQAVVAPAAAEVATTVTVFSEAGQWGDSLSRGTPTGSWPDTFQETFVKQSDIEAQNLLHRISSARVVCGTRPSDVWFFDSGNVDFPYDHDFYQVSCNAGETVNVNFHASNVHTSPNNHALGDKVTSFRIVANPRTFVPLDRFSDQVLDGWNAGIAAQLGTSATAEGPATIRYLSSNSFRLRQSVRIHTPSGCPDADGTFEYDAYFYQNHPTGHPGWYVATASTDVSGAWWCSVQVGEKFKEKVVDGEDAFKVKLNAATNQGDYASYYLNPIWPGSFGLNIGPF
jgi:hypothetical protein